jgi:hypothetical protein
LILSLEDQLLIVTSSLKELEEFLAVLIQAWQMILDLACQSCPEEEKNTFTYLEERIEYLLMPAKNYFSNLLGEVNSLILRWDKINTTLVVYQSCFIFLCDNLRQSNFEGRFEELKEKAKSLDKLSGTEVEKFREDAEELEADYNDNLYIYNDCYCSGVDFSDINFHTIIQTIDDRLRNPCNFCPDSIQEVFDDLDSEISSITEIPTDSEVQSLESRFRNDIVDYFAYYKSCDSCKNKTQLQQKIYEMKIVKCKAEGNCPSCTSCPQDQMERYEQYRNYYFVSTEMQELLKEWNETYPGCNDCFLCSTFCDPFDGLPGYIRNIDNETSKADLDYLLKLTQILQPIYETKKSKLNECDCRYEAKDFDFESAKKKIKLALPCEFCPQTQRDEYFKYEEMHPMNFMGFEFDNFHAFKTLWRKEYPECDACYDLESLEKDMERKRRYLIRVDLGLNPDEYT